MIDVTAPFSLFAHCDVQYEGRAASTLETGNYLIIHKPDGTLLIEAATKTTPRNYQGPKAVLQRHGHVLVSKRKQETITIIIHKLYDIMYLRNWSEAEIAIVRTEKELVQKLITNWNRYIPGEFTEIITEYPTLLGPIDAVGIDKNGWYHAVEVKRKNVSVPHVSQLLRYVTAIKDSGRDTIGYIASPQIGQKALEYCESLGFRYIAIDF